jgi:hypothetical protein
MMRYYSLELEREDLIDWEKAEFIGKRPPFRKEEVLKEAGGVRNSGERIHRYCYLLSLMKKTRVWYQR